MSPLPPVEPDDIELSTAAWSLADAFDGVVSNEDGRPVPRPRSVHPSVDSPLDVPATRESSSIEPPHDSPQTVQLDLFSDGGAVEPQSISLHHLRHWYAIAQALDRSPHRLNRIQTLGLRFKQSFGEAHADLEHLWTGWDDSDYDQWQWDLVVYHHRTHPADTAPIQLSLYPF